MAETNIQALDATIPKGTDPCHPQVLRDLKQTLINQFGKYDQLLDFDVARYSEELERGFTLIDSDTMHVHFKSITSAIIFSGEAYVNGRLESAGGVYANGNVYGYTDPSVVDVELRRPDIHKPMWKYLNDQAPLVDELEARFRKNLHRARMITKSLGGK